MKQHRREVAVIGGGLAGYSAAIGLALKGFDTILAAPAPAGEDRRTTALIGSSLAYLRRIGLFERLIGAAAPLMMMRIVDDSGRIIRAPTAEFRASEIDLPAFGYNIRNADLLHALEERAREIEDRLLVLDAAAEDFSADMDRATIRLSNGDGIEASLAVAADGRHSVLRRAAGLRFRQWSYPQKAIVFNVSHSIGHGDTSTEFHTRSGPFTQVPLSGNHSSLIWVEEPEKAELIAELKPEKLGALIEEKMHSILGRIEVDGPVQTFALSGGSVDRMVSNRLALVGEAAHVFPPIGAQGLNLGLRDAAAIVAVAGEHRDDPGRKAALFRYDAQRRTDVASRTAGVDLLNRSLLTDFLPVQAARAAGLGALNAVPFLRRLAMREGLSPGAGLGGVPRSVREGIGGY